MVGTCASRSEPGGRPLRVSTRTWKRVSPGHRNPNHTSVPHTAVMMVYHHGGQVKVQEWNWNLILSVFWMMKISRTPTPVSEAIAPLLSLRPSG